MAQRPDTHEQRRVGDVTKCPACGTRMDADAYRCPNCRIYFCFKCRRRVDSRDDQYQCVNQQCSYYGKLLCSGCIVDAPRIGEVSRNVLVASARRTRAWYSFDDPLYPSWAFVFCFVASIIVGPGSAMGFVPLGLAWVFPVALGGAVVFAWFWYAAEHGLGVKYEPEQYEVVHEATELGRTRSCIACKQVVQNLK